VYASAEGIQSNPVLVVVTEYQPDVVFVTTDDIVVGPQPVTGAPVPESYEPGLEFQVVLDQSAGQPANGSLLAQDGDNPFVGRVVSSELNLDNAFLVTLEIPTVPEVFNNLQINEEFELQNPNIEFDEALGDYFETAVNIDGSITLTPKLEDSGPISYLQPTKPFDEMFDVQTLSVAGPPVGALAGPALGTIANRYHPFICSFAPEMDLSAIPIRLDLGNRAFNITADFSVPFIYNDTLEKIAVRGEAKAEFKLKTSLTAAVEGKFTCKLAVGQFSIPMPGLLGFLVSTNLKYGIGGEMGLKVKVADIGFEHKASAEMKAEYGYYNPPECQSSGGSEAGETDGGEAGVGGLPEPPMNSSDCGFKGDVESKSSSDFLVDNIHPNFTLDEILQDLTIEPTIGGFGYVEVTVGNPIFKTLSLTFLEVRAGATLAGNFAVPTAQIINSGYKSDYKSTLDVLAKPGSDVDKALTFFKIVSVGKFQSKLSTPLATSPAASGPLIVGIKESGGEEYKPGDELDFHILLDETKTDYIPGVYNVDSIIVYKKLPGSAPQQVASVLAEEDQLDFDLSWVADSEGALKDEFYGFVTTDLFPVPFINGLELGKFVEDKSVLIFNSMDVFMSSLCADGTVANPSSCGRDVKNDSSDELSTIQLSTSATGTALSIVTKTYNELSRGIFEADVNYSDDGRVDGITWVSQGSINLSFLIKEDVNCTFEIQQSSAPWDLSVNNSPVQDDSEITFLKRDERYQLTVSGSSEPGSSAYSVKMSCDEEFN